VGKLQPRAGHIRLNTELVKKPKDLLEYVVVHEMLHLIEPTAQRAVRRAARAALPDLARALNRGEGASS
jgi:predicted metal-dependent hydrolase